DLSVSSTDPDGKTTATRYADVAMGLPTAEIVDPGGLALSTQTGYETGSGGYRRRLTPTLPAGHTSTESYYGDSEVVTNPCDSTKSANQAGALKTNTGPDPDGAGAGTPRVEEFVYDAAGRTVATRVGPDAWTCLTYDSRGRLETKKIPAY